MVDGKGQLGVKSSGVQTEQVFSGLCRKTDAVCEHTPQCQAVDPSTRRRDAAGAKVRFAAPKRFRAKACPGLDPGWAPVRVKKTRQNKTSRASVPIQSEPKRLQRRRFEVR